MLWKKKEWEEKSLLIFLEMWNWEKMDLFVYYM